MGSTMRKEMKLFSFREVKNTRANMIKLATGTDLTVSISGRIRYSTGRQRAASTASSAPRAKPVRKPRAMRDRL